MTDTTPTPVSLDPHALQTGKHLMILESDTSQPAGLLLCRRFTADLVLEGALVGGSADARGLERVIPLGSIHLRFPTDEQDKQAGFEQRMQSIKYQQQVVGEPIPLDRVQKLLELLYTSFDRGLINTLSDADLAKAAGVLTSTMTLGKQRFRSNPQTAAAA